MYLADSSIVTRFSNLTKHYGNPPSDKEGLGLHSTLRALLQYILTVNTRDKLKNTNKCCIRQWPIWRYCIKLMREE